jgi:hypothetical protein
MILRRALDCPGLGGPGPIIELKFVPSAVDIPEALMAEVILAFKIYFLWPIFFMSKGVIFPLILGIGVA